MLTLSFLLLGVALCYASIESATDRLFLLKDEDRDGSISNNEMMTYLVGCDINSDKRLTEAEFFHCSTNRNHHMHPFAVSLFHAFDIGHRRWITLDDAGIKSIMNAFDGDANGSVDKAEFEGYLHHRLHHGSNQ
ncbi:uncharacterized protein [Haliotis cracherodii]|uniref:uncharacterized protein n=1 Tax=Haliotis cracherodii TaxID=6455 RepID=UPI0039E8F516